MNNVDKRFGELLKEHRFSIRMSLREFCRALGVDPSNVSKIERGKSNPPKNKEKLKGYAKVLGILDDKDKWQEFYYSACLTNNIIPDDVDKKLMPVFFRNASGKKPTEEELNEIIKLINE